MFSFFISLVVSMSSSHLHFLLVSQFTLINTISADYCHKSVKHPELRNNLPIEPFEPTLLDTSDSYKNDAFSNPSKIGGFGKRYVAGPKHDEFHVVHLWGSPYELGYHHGKLMKKEVQGFITELWDYLVVAFGEKPLILATQAIIDKTENYVNEDYFEEIRGVAEGAGLDYDKVNRIHAIGELWTFHCSMVGAWDAALEQKAGLIQVHVRTLNLCLRTV